MALTQVSTGGIKDATVATADIADQAVTLAKLPHGTSSTNGKFLRANNGADPSFEDVPAGGISNLVEDTSPQIGGDLESNGHDIKIADATGYDGNNLYMGTGADCRIHHDGSNFSIAEATGDVTIQAADDIFLKPQGGENGIKVIGNGSVELYDDNSMKFTTTSSGARLNGNLVINDGSQIQLQNSSANRSSEIVNTGSSTNSTISFKTNGSERVLIDQSGNVGIGKTPARRLDIDTSHYVVTSSGQATTGIHLDGNAGNAGEYGGGISFACGNSGSAAIAARQATSDPDVDGLSFFTHDSSTGSADAVEKVRIHDGGATSFAQGIVLGNGLTYSSSNKMDDYEEGTYTPTLTGYGSTTNLTLYSSESTISYVKIGNKCWFNGRIRINNDQYSGYLRMTLPFASAQGTNCSNCGMSAIATHGVDYPETDNKGLFFETYTNATLGVFVFVRDDTGWTNATNAHITGNDYLTFNHHYTTA